MSGYLLRRLLQFVPVFLGATLLIYLLVFALPGDPIQALAGDLPVPPAVAATLRARYHLDDPLIAQYGRFVLGILRGDFGIDLRGQEISPQIARSWPVTMQLALTAWLLQIVVAIPLGVVASLRTRLGAAVLLLTTLPVAIPSFVVALVAQLVLALDFRLFPVAGIEFGWPRSYILPALVLSVFGMARITRLTRAAMLENLGADFVRTAVAKGLLWRTVVVRHVLRNSLIPVTTYLGIDLGALLSGTVLVEGIFNLPGLGGLIFRGIQDHDGPVVVSVATLLLLVYLTSTLVVDLLYPFLDPRIRLGATASEA